ncbi:MAG: chorismate mutase [Candidatus Gracilibacteria bacterium]|nr:chorismate mutase [Candidatus Gracilibacteria bacterium]
MDLTEIRPQIDSIDSQLVELLAKRFDLVEKVAIYKKENSINSLQPGRWQEILDTRKEQAEGLGIDPEMIEEIWNIIHKFALKMQNSILENK